jgi:hypothetical protein
VNIATLLAEVAKVDPQAIAAGGGVAAALGGAALLVRKLRQHKETVDQVIARALAEQLRIEAAHHCKFVPHHREIAVIQRARLYCREARVKVPLDLKARVRRILRERE